MTSNFIAAARRYALVSAVALAAAGLAACAGPGEEADESGLRSELTGTAHAAADGSTVIARFAGKAFTENDLLDQLGTLNKRSRKALDDPDRRKQFVENYVLSTLIYDEGMSKGFDKDPGIRKQLEDLERRLVIQKVMQEHQTAPVDEAEVKAYYDNNPNEFTSDRVGARHILVEDESTAKELAEKLAADPTQFEELAKEYSVDKSNSAKGGDLGVFGRGRMVKEFEEAAFGLTADGEVSDIVQTRFGYHLIQRTQREDGAAKPFEEVKNQIRIRMINDKRREQTENFLADLKTRSEYTLDEEALAGVDLSALDSEDGAE